MKKIAVGILTATLIVGVATAAFAQEDGKGIFNFGQMKPHMEQMHPDLSTKELKDMFESCHGKDGMMQNNDMMEEMNFEKTDDVL